VETDEGVLDSSIEFKNSPRDFPHHYNGIITKKDYYGTR
jgi:hypothetical protein